VPRGGAYVVNPKTDKKVYLHSGEGGMVFTV
jgi:hypothetical protein